MNIEETTKQPTIVDPSLRDAPKLDLSSIRANVDAIQAEALRLNDIIQAMPKQESTVKGSTVPPMDSTGKMQVPQLQQKTEEQRMAEFQNQRQMSFQAMGITEEDFNKRQNLATQMSSLNAQLQQLDVAEQQAMLDIENLMPGALLSRVRGEQAQVIRTMSFKKAGIAAQMSALSGEYSALQGRIDEAQKFFNQYIEYATFEKKQEMDDYKWALEFYYDADQDTKKWLQQEYENKQGEYDRQYREEQDKISNWFKEQGLNIDIARERRLSEEVTGLSSTLNSEFAEDLSFVASLSKEEGMDFLNKNKTALIQKYGESNYNIMLQEPERLFPASEQPTVRVSAPTARGVGETLRYFPGEFGRTGQRFGEFVADVTTNFFGGLFGF